MLPAAADFPQTPMRQYDAYNPPITGIRFHPECQQFGNAIIAKVANLATQMANQSPARMFCYNLLSSNNWNNQEFANMCVFAGDLMVLFFHRQQTRIIEQYLDNAVDCALRLKTSQYVCNSPELQNLCGSEICRSSLDNLQVLNEVTQGIQQIQSQNNQQQMPLSAPMRQQTVGIPSYYGQQNSFPQFGNNTGPSLVDLQSDRFASRKIEKTSVQGNQQQGFQRPLEIKPITLVSEPTMEESGIAVEFSNQTYPASNVVKSEMKIEVPKEEIQITSVESENSEDLSIAISEEQSEDLSYNPIVIVEDTLDSMILTTKALYIKNSGDTDFDKFYRVFGYYVSSYFSNESFDENTKYWKTFTDFSLFGKRLYDEIQAIKSSDFKNDGSLLNIDGNKNFRAPVKVHQYFALISMTDNIFTKAINTFVKYELDMAIRIDSFVTDSKDLKQYIENKSEEKYHKFLEWEKEFFDTYAFEIDESVTPFNVPEDVQLFGTPIFASVTCVKQPNLKTFIDVNLQMGESKVIECEGHEAIWLVHKTMQEHKQKFNSQHSEDYYVMANNERIRVFTSDTNEHKLTIVRV